MVQESMDKTAEAWTEEFPLLQDIMALRPVFWANPSVKSIYETPEFPVSRADIIDAEERWRRFAPFLQEAFPETKESRGIIESPLRSIPKVKKLLESHYHEKTAGKLYLKCDNELPIAGSIKARGGIYEVLKHAETLAMENGMLKKNDNYKKFASPEFKKFFSQYSVGVGSTGNLGLSIGIISAKLGFDVMVHMSADAKQWKKDLLREKGARVFEYEADFSKAINEGRELSTRDPKSYFVDDENSRDLYLGYSVAALRLKEQLERKRITVDKDHPLFVYLPCGVGGSPGGITFGLKQIFGDFVHCIFVEPTHSPSVLIGLLTGQHEKVSVQDFGIDNHTEADGLAVGTPSSFATAISEHLVSGIYTFEDDELFKMLAMLIDAEGIKVEPSAASGLQGPIRLRKSRYLADRGLESKMDQATHIAWATGGALVPEEDMKRFYEKGKKMLGE
ncbi:MAG TPA: D-serine ammonia-lyase [Bacillales bacterium]|nr:D-serine ammonia-lyase [Bacillales bacterium]